MARYAYLVSDADPGLWVLNDHFHCLHEKDSPSRYACSCTSLVKAQHLLFERVLEHPGIFDVIHKFDAKPPYKYHGVV
ncbi:hypothetical protein D3C71_480100 [compost metagenome]